MPVAPKAARAADLAADPGTAREAGSAVDFGPSSDDAGSIWAIVVAGGRGARFGSLKQFALLNGVPVVERSIRACRSVAHGVVLVVPAGYGTPTDGTAIHGAANPGAGTPGTPTHGADKVVVGGERRSDSVRQGLAAVPEDASIVVVHDAARPLASASLFRAAVDALASGVDGAICAVPVTDTIKRVAGGVVVETLDRSSLVAVQTPQAFRAAALRKAHASQADATDDAALVEAAGGTVVVVAGEARNAKLTEPEDLQRAASALVGTTDEVPA